MVIDGDWKIKVRMMDASKNFEGAKRELIKAKMSQGYKLTDDKNKIFVDYCLARYGFIEKNYELTNYYLAEIEKIFNNDEQKIFNMKKEYCNYLWLKVDTNHENMDIEDIIKDMTVSYKYYMLINEREKAIGALINIFCFKRQEDEIIKSLDQLLKYDKSYNYDFINNILEACDSISHELYIKALKVIDENNININIDIV